MKQRKNKKTKPTKTDNRLSFDKVKEVIANNNSEEQQPALALQDPSMEMKQQINEELQLLSGRVDEFLKTFIILGYTLDGIPIQIVSSKTPQDIDSLNVILQRFIYSNSIPGKTSPPEPNVVPK